MPRASILARRRFRSRYHRIVLRSRRAGSAAPPATYMRLPIGSITAGFRAWRWRCHPLGPARPIIRCHHVPRLPAITARGIDPRFDLRSELPYCRRRPHRHPRNQRSHCASLLTEIGTDVNRSATPLPSASWLGLCPEKRVSSGKGLSCKTCQVKHRVATALRMGRELPVPRERLLWRVLSAYAGQNSARPKRSPHRT